MDWTVPAGFDVEDDYPQVNADEFLAFRRALERIEQGYTYADAADGIPVAESTLRALYENRSDLYFYTEAEDERLQAATKPLEQLENPDIPADSNFPQRIIRTIVRDEIHRHQQYVPYQRWPYTFPITIVLGYATPIRR